jgi:hypothetical protein
MSYPNRNAAFLASWTKRVQEFEDAAWTLLDALNVDNATDDLQDKIGSLVGEPRQGRGTVEYRAAIRLRIRVNRSFGRTEDVIDVARLAAINSTPTFDEYYPAAFEVGIANLPGGASVAKLLGQARAGGIYGVLNFTADASAALVLDDAVTTLGSAGLLDDSVTTIGGAGVLSSAQVA